MEILGVLGIIFMLAFLVETLVEFVASPFFDHIPTLKPFTWAQMYIAIIVGVGGAFIYKFDLLYLFGQFLDVNVISHPFGIAITGIAIGKGANYLHDLIVKFFTKPEVE